MSLLRIASLLLLPCLPVCDVSPLATIFFFCLVALIFFLGGVPANVAVGIAVLVSETLFQAKDITVAQARFLPISIFI